MTTAISALVAGVTVAVAAAVDSHPQRGLIVALAVVAIAALLLGVWSRAAAGIAVFVGVAGAAWTLRWAEAGRDVGDGAPVVAAALWLSAELAWWAIGRRDGAKVDVAVVTRRLAWMAAVVALTLALGSAVLDIAGTRPGGGLTVQLVGALAAAVALVAVAAPAGGRRPRRGRSTGHEGVRPTRVG